jgi:aspartyl-tRNA(Asn)/glutamyl-tRNA(Gln) amidotransferase subunit A
VRNPGGMPTHNRALTVDGSGELATQSLARVREAVRSGQLSASSIVETVLNRIERHNGELRAYVALDPEGALRNAGEVDAVIASGGDPGLLCGVPLGVKDVFLSTDMPTTMGSAVHQGGRSSIDAAVIGRLRECGAPVLGFHTAHELAYGPTGDVSFPDAAVNPRFPDRVPGGSSSGSAVAVAAYLAYGSVGTDTGGSVRIPSALNGLVGLKPTTGRISRFGTMELAPSLDHVGPITRSIDDNAVLLRALARADPRDPVTWRHRAELDIHQATGDLRGVRLGVLGGYFHAETHGEVASVVRSAVDNLVEAGATTCEVVLPGASAAFDAQRVITATEAHWVNRHHLGATSGLGAEVRQRLLLGAEIGMSDYLDARRDAAIFEAQVRAACLQVDVLVCPTVSILPPPIGERQTVLSGIASSTYARLTRFTAPFSVTASPALTVPCGHSAAGFPIGMQLIGAPYSEPMLYRIGRALELA